jgi:hypothetical protein
MAARERAAAALQRALDSTRKHVEHLLLQLCRAFEVQMTEVLLSKQPPQHRLETIYAGYTRFLAYLTAQLLDPALFDAAKHAELQDLLVGGLAVPPNPQAAQLGPQLQRLNPPPRCRRRAPCRARSRRPRTSSRPAAARAPRRLRRPAQQPRRRTA